MINHTLIQLKYPFQSLPNSVFYVENLILITTHWSIDGANNRNGPIYTLFCRQTCDGWLLNSCCHLTLAPAEMCRAWRSFTFGLWQVWVAHFGPTVLIIDGRPTTDNVLAPWRIKQPAYYMKYAEIRFIICFEISLNVYLRTKGA